MKPTPKRSSEQNYRHREKLDFPVIQFAGPTIRFPMDYFVHSTFNRAQLLAAVPWGSLNPKSLIVPSTYDQFDSEGVLILPCLRKEFWQPAFFLFSRYGLTREEIWADQIVAVTAMVVLGTIDLRYAGLPQLIIKLSAEKHMHEPISARDLFQASDRLTEQADRRSNLRAQHLIKARSRAKEMT